MDVGHVPTSYFLFYGGSMGCEWTRAKTKEGKEAIKAALMAGCYNPKIDYDNLGVTPGLLAGEISNIKELQQNYLDSVPDQPEKIKPGRKNRGLTKLHYEEKKQFIKDIKKVQQPDNFNNDLIERVHGEVITDFDINQYKELVQLTFESVLEDFKQNNPDLVKRHPYNYYKKLLIELKKQLPKITVNDIDKMYVVWDSLSELLNNIGLYITWGAFEQLTGIYKYQIEKKSGEGLNQKYIDFMQKILKDCDTALIGELQYNPYNQTNKIFLAKVAGHVEKTETKQIEVHHDIRNYDTLPMLDRKN